MKLFLTLLFLQLFVVSYSQEWLTLEETTDYKITYSTANKEDVVNDISNLYYLIQIENKLNTTLELKISKELSYSNSAEILRPDQKTVILLPNQVITGSLTSESDKFLRVFVKANLAGSKKVLTDWKITTSIINQ